MASRLAVEVQWSYMNNQTHRTSSTPWGWYSLLLIPFVAILWVPFYVGGAPELAGIPFFYWYQFLWVLISAAITAIVYVITREPESELPEGEAPINKDLA